MIDEFASIISQLLREPSAATQSREKAAALIARIRAEEEMRYYR